MGPGLSRHTHTYAGDAIDRSTVSVMIVERPVRTGQSFTSQGRGGPRGMQDPVMLNVPFLEEHMQAALHVVAHLMSCAVGSRLSCYSVGPGPRRRETKVAPAAGPLPWDSIQACQSRCCSSLGSHRIQGRRASLPCRQPEAGRQSESRTSGICRGTEGCLIVRGPMQQSRCWTI